MFSHVQTQTFGGKIFTHFLFDAVNTFPKNWPVFITVLHHLLRTLNKCLGTEDTNFRRNYFPCLVDVQLHLLNSPVFVVVFRARQNFQWEVWTAGRPV